MKFKHMFLTLILAAVITMEIGITAAIHKIFVEQENHDKTQLLKQTNMTLANNIASSSKNYLHNVATKAGFFKQVNKFMSPDNFSAIIRTDLDEIPVSSQRWMPFVNNSEREQFESFYGQYYANFTIRDISFDGTIFTISRAAVRPFYYPFALSIPEFTLVPMGGDFYLTSVQFLEALNSSVQPNYSSRVQLARPNNNIDYGIYLQSFVKKNDTPWGVYSALIIPSENIKQILLRQQIFNDSLSYYIFDNRVIESTGNIEEALIYRSVTSSPVTNLQVLVSEPNAYTMTIEPLVYVFIYNDIFTESIETDLPLVAVISFALLSFLIDIIIITGYIFYIYRLKAIKNLTYREMLDFINHELRNPLNAMIGSITFLTEKIKRSSSEIVDNNYLIDKLELCESQCSLMIYIIERVKSMKMLIEGKKLEEITVLETTKLILRDLINIVNATIKGRIEEHGALNYNVDYLCDQNLELCADKNRLIEVLLNVIDNAVKYSKPKQDSIVNLTISKQDNNIIFKVSDNGIGIPSEMNDKLFKPYVRVNNDNNVSGSGLGLYYCKLICEKMGGSISYTSQFGIGTVFTVIIPHIETDTNSDNDDNDEFTILNLDTVV